MEQIVEHCIESLFDLAYSEYARLWSRWFDIWKLGAGKQWCRNASQSLKSRSGPFTTTSAATLTTTLTTTTATISAAAAIATVEASTACAAVHEWKENGKKPCSTAYLFCDVCVCVCVGKSLYLMVTLDVISIEIDVYTHTNIMPSFMAHFARTWIVHIVNESHSRISRVIIFGFVNGLAITTPVVDLSWECHLSGFSTRLALWMPVHKSEQRK